LFLKKFQHEIPEFPRNWLSRWHAGRKIIFFHLWDGIIESPKNSKKSPLALGPLVLLVLPVPLVPALPVLAPVALLLVPGPTQDALLVLGEGACATLQGLVGAGEEV
jgi:hypothetical protein